MLVMIDTPPFSSLAAIQAAGDNVARPGLFALTFIRMQHTIASGERSALDLLPSRMGG